jgi:dTDP-4-amino-4,6-dideoxygalactose transaminase
MISCANPHAQYLSHQIEIDRAIKRVLESGRYILSEEVKCFEQEFSVFNGSPFAVGVGSGTEALHLALAALSIGSGDEVITVSHTAVATIAAILLVGAKPVLVDIDPNTYTLDPKKLGAAITSRTRAVIPVHLYGQAADLDAIKEITHSKNIKIIEDCAQAHGARSGAARVGTRGDLGCFSFYPTKNLGALGDGGIITCHESSIEKKIRLLREYGWAERYHSHIVGWNSRLDELQAGILRVKLKYLDHDNSKRMALAQIYKDQLSNLDLILPFTKNGNTHVYHLFVLALTQRDKLQKFLASQEIQCGIHYPIPIHQQLAYREKLGVSGRLEITEKIANQILSLPLYPELEFSDVQTVALAIKGFFNET